ncbi:MAG: HisA/HisF-related TIM barrel protein [Candidatus Omnitrophica bacterium]|nr:HisA/HisF-related TIM barrel protein [Candidatus Omnitrophota bacterium]
MLIIPAIDLKKSDVVRLYKGRFDKISFYDIEFEKIMKDYIKSGVKRIHIVFLFGAKTGKIGEEEEEKVKKIIEIKELTNMKELEIQIGGGIRRKEQIEKFFELGVNYLVIGTAFLIPFALTEGYSIQDIKFFYQRTGKKFILEKEVPEFELIEYLKQEIKDKIIVSIDYIDNEIALSGWEVTIPIKPSYAIKKFLEKGFKRFIITSIESDGTLGGIDIKNISTILKEIENHRENIKDIIVAGGVSKEEDIILLNSLKYKPTGVIIGKALYQKKIDLKNVIEKYQES